MPFKKKSLYWLANGISVRNRIVFTQVSLLLSFSPHFPTYLSFYIEIPVVRTGSRGQTDSAEPQKALPSFKGRGDELWCGVVQGQNACLGRGGNVQGGCVVGCEFEQHTER